MESIEEGWRFYYKQAVIEGVTFEWICTGGARVELDGGRILQVHTASTKDVKQEEVCYI